MRSTLFLAALWATFAIGCGGGSDSNNGTSGATGRSAATGGKCPTTSANGCPAAKSYETCVLGKCDASYKAAFGLGYASGDFSGGACASLLTCYLKCPCDATAASCELACYSQRDATCDTAMAAVTTCVMGSGCAYPVCSDTSTLTSTLTSSSTSTLTRTSTSTSTGSSTGSCAAASTCCAKLIAGSNAVTYQQTCQIIASYGEAACAQILAGWVSAGVCQ